MLSEKDYVRLSLETNVFFLRIVKEHAIFAAASLPPKDASIANQLMMTKNSFEILLDRAVILSQGILSEEVRSSGELVTDLTLPSENITQFLTGLPINTNITRREMALVGIKETPPRSDISGRVAQLNRDAINGTVAAIGLKTTLLNNVLNCRAFSYTYPSMLHHVIEEAKFYVSLLRKLENNDSIDTINEIIELEIFWNDIMSEHPKFIRGYLDPFEKQLFEKANTFSNEFDELLARTKAMKSNPAMLSEITKESQQKVTALRDFKRQGTAGILACKVKGIMPPLLADHVTREANHYLRLLRSFNKVPKPS